MTARLRLGTRGSDLAMAQSKLVAEMLRERASLETDLVVISTTGDREQTAPAHLATWSTGSFVSELERSLLDGQIDLAVHSYKDMPTAITHGLAVAAVPERASPHDVLVCASADHAAAARRALEGGPPAASLVVGTSSLRRAAQLRRAIGCRIEPLRGNVPTRLARVGGTIDAACLASAGLERLGLRTEHTLTLDVERFPTAAAQGALAIQTRHHADFADSIAAVEDRFTRTAVESERSFLRTIEAGCHTAVGAFAHANHGGISLIAEYHDDGGQVFRITENGVAAEAVGRAAGQKVLTWLSRSR